MEILLKSPKLIECTKLSAHSATRSNVAQHTQVSWCPDSGLLSELLSDAQIVAEGISNIILIKK